MKIISDIKNILLVMKLYSLKQFVLNLHMIFGGLGVDFFLSDDFLLGRSLCFLSNS